MAFVYHLKQPDFQGNTIIPLNRLKTRYPDLFEKQVKKYAGREESLEIRLPHLNVLWNDVVHCAPVHPYYIYQGYTEAGYPPRQPREWFKIPVERIAGFPVLYWHNRLSDEDKFAPAEFKYFEPAIYEELAGLPEIQVAYLREQFLLNNQFPLFAGRVPHVLVEGEIDISDLEVVRWELPPED